MQSEQPQELPFEVALARLDSLVVAMEKGDVPLAELVAKFEEGDKLLRRCQTCLSDAELKIERLRRERGVAKTEPFEELGEE